MAAEDFCRHVCAHDVSNFELTSNLAQIFIRSAMHLCKTIRHALLSLLYRSFKKVVVSVL